MKIYCCGCKTEVEATLTAGKEIYPHREDLYDLPFWKCSCGLFVGCHHKTKDRTKPLGVIPTNAIKALRKQIHAKLDPIWQSKRMSRGEVYARLSQQLGYTYHTAEISSVEDAHTVLNLLNEM